VSHYFAAPVVLVSDINWNAAMNRVGRPATGHQPRLSVRMDPTMLKLASQHAKGKGHTVGRWIEQAIREKIEREKEADNVTKADW